MPRCVRNFWIELDVDGRKHRIATGPKGSGGGFRLVIRHRANGRICPVRHEVRGFLTPEGRAHLRVSRGQTMEPIGTSPLTSLWSIIAAETCTDRS